MKPEQIQHIFNDAYAAQSDAIFRFCLIRVSDREQALDITQETFTRLWQSLQRGEQIANVRAFLFTVTRRLIIDWYRKKKSISLESLSDAEEGNEPFEPIDETAMADLERGSEGRFVLEKIGQLGPSYRQPVYLRFVEGFSPQEIAEIMNISANAASVRINRGLEELREKTGYTEQASQTHHGK